MNKTKRHFKIKKLLNIFLKRYLPHKFNYSWDIYSGKDPYLVIPNHVTNWDPLLVSLSFPNNLMYYVASEHIFRKGFLSKLLVWALEPIPRNKGSVGTETILNCMRKLKSGHSICLFAEGNCTWDGISTKALTATGKLIKKSGVSLVTYRIEGGYFSFPRWSKKARRGEMHGTIVNVYTPEMLSNMTPEQITDIINNDIYENAWERQRLEKKIYKSNHRAENIETALFMCPNCKKIGTIFSHGNSIYCKCGLHIEIDKYGFFQPPKPFETMADWDIWQLSQLKNIIVSANNWYDTTNPININRTTTTIGTQLELTQPQVTTNIGIDATRIDDDISASKYQGQNSNTVYFQDYDISLTKLLPKHQQTFLTCNTLCQFNNYFSCGEFAFNFDDIQTMSMIQTHILVFSYKGENFELKSKKPCCLRKYLVAWQHYKQMIRVDAHNLPTH